MRRSLACITLIAFLIGTVVLSQSVLAQDPARSAFNESIRLKNAGEKNWDRAAELAFQVADSNPYSAEYASWASWMCYLIDRPGLGIQYGERSIRLQPQNFQHWLNTAFNAFKDGQFSLAAQCYRATLARYPDPVHAKEAQDGLARLETREYVITWRIPTSQQVHVPVPPQKLPYQESEAEYVGTHSIATVADNEIATIAPLQGASEVVYTLRIKRHIHSLNKELTGSHPIVSACPLEVKPYLESSNTISTQGPVVRQIISELPPTTDAVKRLRDILSWLKQNMTYGLTDPWVPVDDLLTRHWAECGGYSRSFCALARASGIPARVIWVMMVMKESENAGKLKGHAVAEAYVKGIGWVPVEPQQPLSLGTLPTNCLNICIYSDAVLQRWQNDELGPDSDTPPYSMHVLKSYEDEKP